MYAEVLIQYGVKILDKTFTYKIPSFLNVRIGNKVKVLFANKEIFGIVINIKNDTDIDNLNEIIDVVNPDLFLTNELLELGKYLSDTTFCTLIKSYQTMLPTALKVKNIKTNFDKYIEYIILNKKEEEVKEYIFNNKRCKSQIEILN